MRILAPLALASVLAPFSQAQTFTEVGDAGDLLGNGQIPPGAGPLTQIDGAHFDPVDADMYLIRIVDPAIFEATTTGGSAEDTQLFLFDLAGNGITTNDDDPLGGLQSRITGVFVPGPGLYWLAISDFDNDPLSAGNLIWNNTPFNTERAPDGPGAPGPVDAWDGASAIGGGPYSIFLTGAAFPNPVHKPCTPGSVLVYPIHRSGPTWFTILCVTNTATEPATPLGLGGTTNAHFEYVNVVPGSSPFAPRACSIFDRIETLTPADTLCVLARCHNAFAPGGQEGYVVVSAEDPTAPPGVAWDHDFLIGSELVISATGIAYALKARSIAAFQPNPAVAPAPLPFDDVAYSALPDRLYIDSFLAIAESSLTLINLTGGPTAQNSVVLSVWNDNELPLSAHFRFTCWFDQPLSVVSPLFSQAFLASTPNDPNELDVNCDGVGDLETGWAIIDSNGVWLPGGPRIATDGAMLGAITSGASAAIAGGRLLWESPERQVNGAFRTP